MEKKGKAIIVGGSIAGVSCAHSLKLAGWDVLDPQARKIIKSWLPRPHLLDEITLPLLIDQATDSEKKMARITTRDKNFDFLEAFWADIHALLYNALPQSMFLWGHKFLSFTISQDESTVKVKTSVVETQEIVEIQGELLVAADGCLSSIRKTFLPDLNLSEQLNDQQDASRSKTIWSPDLARLMRETKDPFHNVIYDCDSLERIFWGNVVLVGDAAHPTTPHGLRSTNMSILDAEVLGKCLEKCGPENLSLGLEEYQRIILPIVSEQALYARRLGRIKEGLDREDIGLEQKNMPFFSSAPLV